MSEYPIFKNGIAYIDHTVQVWPDTAIAWIEEHNIKKIITLTHGTDHIHTEILPVENRPGINTDSTAQWCIWKLLEWAYKQEPPIETESKEKLLIGVGNIGGTILGWVWCSSIDKTDYDQEKEYLQELKEKTQKADIIFLCINPEKNEGFWNAEKMGWMKPNAILISPSRPSVFHHDTKSDKRLILDWKHKAWKTDAAIQRKRKEIENNLF